MTRLGILFSRLIAYMGRSTIIARLMRGAFWSLIGTAVSRVITLVTSIWVARLLGVEGFGELGIITSTVGMFGVLAGFGLGSTITKSVAEHREMRPDKASAIWGLVSLIGLGISFFIASCLFVFAEAIAMYSFGRTDITQLLQISAFLLFLGAMSGIQHAALSGVEVFAKIARLNIIQAVISPFITIPAIWWFGIVGAVVSYCIIAGIGVMLTLIVVKDEFAKFGISTRYQHAMWQEREILWSFSLPALLSAMLVAPVNWVCNAILVNQSNGFSDMGIYNAANQWRLVVMLLPQMLSAAMLPILAETYSRPDKNNFNESVYLNLRLVWVISLPIAVLMILFGANFAKLYGSEYVGMEMVLPVLMAAVFFNIVCAPVGTALAGSSRMWTGAIMNYGWAIVLILLSVVLVPLYKAVGLAIANLLAYFLHVCWVMVYVERKLSPGAISSQASLLVFGLIIIVASLFVEYMIIDNWIAALALVCVSLLPAMNILYKKYNLSFQTGQG